MGRPNTALVISESEKSQLQSLVRSRSMPHAVVRRAKIVLLSAAGSSNRAVATQCGVSAPVVSLWRSRYQRDGLAGLHSELRPGRPRKHGDDKVAGLLRTVLRSKPEVVTHWTVRSAAAKTVRSGAISPCLEFNRTAPRALSCPPTRSSSKRFATSLGFILIRRTTRWYYAWTRRARCRPWSAPSRCCRWDSVMSRA